MKQLLLCFTFFQQYCYVAPGNTIVGNGPTSYVWTLAWLPDGTRIASASWDTTVQVWKATTGRQVFTYRGHTTIVDALAWSPNGERIASVADDVRVWQAS